MYDHHANIILAQSSVSWTDRIPGLLVGAARPGRGELAVCVERASFVFQGCCHRIVPSTTQPLHLATSVLLIG